MYARVAKWEGSSAEEIREMASAISASDGPPEGVPAKGFMLLVDPDAGKSMAITLFDSEDDMRTGHEALDRMSPPAETMGRRTGVEFYEVAADLKAP